MDKDIQRAYEIEKEIIRLCDEVEHRKSRQIYETDWMRNWEREDKLGGIIMLIGLCSIFSLAVLFYFLGIGG